MKKSIFTSLSLVLLGLATSCKKAETPAPVTNTVTVTKTDTVTKTVTVYDTVHVVGMNLIGIWKVYQIETITSGNSSISGNAWVWDFTPTQMLMDPNGSGTYQYTYTATYGTNYVTTQYNSTAPQTYDISTAGNEYRLTTVQSSNQTQVLYLKNNEMKKLIISALLLINVSVFSQISSGKEFINFGLMPFKGQLISLKENRWSNEKGNNEAGGKYSVEEYNFTKEETGGTSMITLSTITDNNTGNELSKVKLTTLNTDVYNRLVIGFNKLGLYFTRDAKGKSTSTQKQYILSYWVEVYQGQKFFVFQIIPS